MAHRFPQPAELGDFTATPRVIVMAAGAILLGVISAFVAVLLLKLIALCTNLFFFGRMSLETISPGENRLGPGMILVPVLGGLIIGAMARYGSDKIRGHGIPEALESILIHGSRIAPRVAFLKPISSAISIGSGGPFGAEGPIIMTGGAIGSLVAQFFHLTSSERKTLLVSGAAAGMSATFAAPLASCLLAVELLLFEWKPRSFVPVALASVTASMVRRYLLGMGPLFPTPPHPEFIGPVAMLCCLVCGLLAGGLSALLARGVYATEDLFGKLPIHWMWWPALGGLAVGLGGYIFPPALGVGYENIGALLQGSASLSLITGVLLVKSTIWLLSLGSGTSGGVLAPVLMMGGALGGLEALVFPPVGAGFWPLISMGAMLGGTMRAPLTGAVFAYELTHDGNSLLPLLLASVTSYAFNVLVTKRSILTEKITRRGYHISCEYAIDPLEILFVREVMRTSFTSVGVDEVPVAGVQRLYPVVGGEGELVNVISRSEIDGRAARDFPPRDVVVAFPDEPLRVVIHRMAETGLTRLPVVSLGEVARVVGMVSLTDLLQARVRLLAAENRRETVLRFRRRD